MNTNLHEAPLPKFSAEARLRQRQADLRFSGAFLAALVDILPSQLSNAYRGLKALDNNVATELLEITQYLLEVRDALAAFSLPLMNSNDTRILINHLRSRGVTPEKIRETVTALPAGNE